MICSHKNNLSSKVMQNTVLILAKEGILLPNLIMYQNQ